MDSTGTDYENALISTGKSVICRQIYCLLILVLNLFKRFWKIPFPVTNSMRFNLFKYRNRYNNFIICIAIGNM